MKKEKKPFVAAKFTLDCDYYEKSFSSRNDLIEDILKTGMDPNYEILKDGEPTGETAWDDIEGQGI